MDPQARTHRRSSRWRAHAVCALAALAAASPAAAQATEFYPSIGIESAYTDNVYFVQTGLSDDGKVSDTTNSLTVGLPLRRTWTTRSLEASYEGRLEKHSEVDDLDNDSHSARMIYEASKGPYARFTFNTSFEHTQSPGNPTSLDASAILVTDRTDRDLYSVAAEGRKEVGRHWRWLGDVAISRYDYTPIDGVTLSTAVIEDRVQYHVGTGFSRVIRRGTALGFSYAYERFVLDFSGTQDNHFIGAALQHEPNRDYSLNADLGVFLQNTRTGPEGSGSGLQGTFGMRRLFRRVDLLATAERVPSSGGVLQGTATETAASLELRGKPLRAWLWTIGNRYAIRDASQSGASTIHALAASGSLEWFVLRQMGVGISADYVDQGGSKDVPELNGSYVVAAMRLVWYPRGSESVRRRAAR